MENVTEMRWFLFPLNSITNNVVVIAMKMSVARTPHFRCFDLHLTESRQKHIIKWRWKFYGFNLRQEMQAQVYHETVELLPRSAYNKPSDGT